MGYKKICLQRVLILVLGMVASAQLFAQAEHERLQCRIDTTLPAQRAKARAHADSACALAPSMLADRLRAKNATVIDVRVGLQQHRSRIPGAWVLQPSELRRYESLRTYPLILVGDGKDDSELFEQCVFLKENGFKQVSVLKGGVLSWVKEGQAFLTNDISVQDLQRLSQADLLRASLAADKLILVAPDAKPLVAVLSGSQLLDAVTPKTIALAVNKAKVNQQYAAVIVVGAHAWPTDVVEAFTKASSLPLFVFYGEASAFDDYVKRQAQIWSRAQGSTQLQCPGV